MRARYKNYFSAVSAAVFIFSAARFCSASDAINGAGATFPYPIYTKWFDEYHKANPDIRINYQSIGSGGGIRQFTDKTVDFGASDSPMNDNDLAKINEPVQQIPTVLGAVVPAFNLKGIDSINFSGEVLASIYLGEITQWDDAALKKLNPGVKLPSANIIVVHRADGSGTTFCFTDYLSAVSASWKNSVGKGQSVNWPLGLGAKGNEGVTGMIRQSQNSIGYLELTYAKQSGVTFGAVKNQAGHFVKADVESVGAAGAAVTMPADFRVSIVNAPGDKSYPISTYTWLLLRVRNNGQVGSTLKGFLSWMITTGEGFAPDLDYAPLPENVKEMVKKAASKIQ